MRRACPHTCSSGHVCCPLRQVRSCPSRGCCVHKCFAAGRCGGFFQRPGRDNNGNVETKSVRSGLLHHPVARHCCLCGGVGGGGLERERERTREWQRERERNRGRNQDRVDGWHSRGRRDKKKKSMAQKMHNCRQVEKLHNVNTVSFNTAKFNNVLSNKFEESAKYTVVFSS